MVVFPLRPLTSALLPTLLLLLLPTATAASEAAGPIHLTQEDAVQRALAASYALVAIDKRIADAESYAERSGAWLASNPFISGGGSASDSTFDRAVGDSDPSQPPPTKDFVARQFGPSYTFTLQQDFEIAGQRGLRMETAARGLEVTRHERRSTEASVRAEAKKAFAAALFSEAKVELAERAAQLISRVNAAFELKPNGPDSERIAYNSSTMQLYRQRRRVGTAKRASEEALRQLKRVTGIPLELQIEIEGALVARPLELPSYEHLRQGLMDRREDVAAYRALLRRADAELALAQRLAIPDLSLFAFVSRFDGGDGGDETSGGGSLGFNLPLFQPNGPSIPDAISERQRAAKELDDLMALVETNLGTAYGSVQDAAADLESMLNEILPRARENVELQRRRADRGEVESYDTVDYEIDLVNADEELVTAQRVYTDTMIELEKAAALPLLTPVSEGSPAAAGAEQKSSTEE